MRICPGFSLLCGPVFVLNIVWSIVRVVRSFSFGTIVSLLVAIALFVLAFTARIFALTVQDRVIRLEMRLRMQQTLPPDLTPRIPEFTVEPALSLRFASDAELPDLARKVLEENLTERKAIKALVRNWQPDHLRASGDLKAAGDAGWVGLADQRAGVREVAVVAVRAVWRERDALRPSQGIGFPRSEDPECRPFARRLQVPTCLSLARTPPT